MQDTVAHFYFVRIYFYQNEINNADINFLYFKINVFKLLFNFKLNNVNYLIKLHIVYNK